MTNDFRSLVAALVDRLGSVQPVISPGWESIAKACDVAADNGSARAALLFGPPAAVLKHAADETREFGFVMPTAQIAKRWQRARAWRDDATLDLWQAGWSTVAVDRLLVPTTEATIELVIGNARPTPRVAAAPEAGSSSR